MDKATLCKVHAALWKLADASYSPGSHQRPFGPEGRGRLPLTIECISKILRYSYFQVPPPIHKLTVLIL
jgi:hypothetical protein